MASTNTCKLTKATSVPPQHRQFHKRCSMQCHILVHWGSTAAANSSANGGAGGHIQGGGNALPVACVPTGIQRLRGGMSAVRVCIEQAAELGQRQAAVWGAGCWRGESGSPRCLQ